MSFFNVNTRLINGLPFTPTADYAASGVYYVNSSIGSDSNPGSYAAPFATIQAGLAAAGAYTAGAPGIVNVVDGGPYVLTGPIDIPDGVFLNAADSFFDFGGGDGFTFSGVQFARLSYAAILSIGNVVINNGAGVLFVEGTYTSGTIVGSTLGGGTIVKSDFLQEANQPNIGMGGELIVLAWGFGGVAIGSGPVYCPASFNLPPFLVGSVSSSSARTSDPPGIPRWASLWGGLARVGSRVGSSGPARTMAMDARGSPPSA